MNKIIINFGVVSCFALGATFAHAAKSVNYYEAYDPHGAVQTAVSGARGVIHPEHPIDSVSDTGAANPNAPTPQPQEMTHPGHTKGGEGA